MKFVRDRRQFLRDGALAGVLGFLPYGRLTQAQPAQLRTVRLSEKMLAVIGPNSNVLATDTTDGIVLIDGGHSSWSSELLAAIDDAYSSRPLRALFNTHWHPEQTGSNLAFAERGGEIIAHENTKLWLGTEVWVRWSDIRYAPLPEAARPTTTLYDSGSMQIADRVVEYGYMLNAHTDGDIWAFFPEENVLFTGGLVSNDGWPVIDWWTGGWIGGMLDGFDSLLAVANDDTRIIPANGPLMSLAQLSAQQEMYSTVFDRIHDMLRRSLGTDEVLAERPTAEFDEEWGNPELFVTLALQSMWGHLRDAYSKRMRNIA